MLTSRTTIAFPLIAIAIIFALLSGCKKDFMNDTSTSNISRTVENGGLISVNDARKWFEGAKNRNGNESLNMPSQLYPMWYLAKPSKFRGTTDILIVPIVVKDSLVDHRSIQWGEINRV